MGRTRISSIILPNNDESSIHHLKKCVAAVTAVLAATSLITSAKNHCKPRPKYNSILTGICWLKELLKGHPEWFQEQLGMSRYVFKKLSNELQYKHGLKDTQHITADEKLAIFLYFARTGSSSRLLQERFQHSGSTISKYIHSLTKILVGSFYGKYVQPMPPNEVPGAILNNPKLYPFFGACRGAIDGSSIDSWVGELDIARYHNCKGRVTQNVLAASDFQLKFIYILAGWEGSAADSRVFEYARCQDLQLPTGCYFLADAGFLLCDMLLTPYCGVCYHLQEWKRGTQRPQNHQELFSLRHAQARNVVERIFGVFKRQFGLAVAAPEYDSKTQSRFICAMGALHNFIHIHNPTDSITQESELSLQANYSALFQLEGVASSSHQTPTSAAQPVNSPQQSTWIGEDITPGERRRAIEHCDNIALEMWKQYQGELQSFT